MQLCLQLSCQPLRELYGHQPPTRLFGSQFLGSTKERGRLGTQVRPLASAPGGGRAARPHRAFGLAPAATGEARRSASYTARRLRLAEEGSGGGGGCESPRRRRGGGESFPHEGAATCSGEEP